MSTNSTQHYTPMQRTAKRWMGTAFALCMGTALVAHQDPQFTQ
ncbi:MAG: hypothetical protein ACK6A5_13580 [Flavobacteriales bacterium]